MPDENYDELIRQLSPEQRAILEKAMIAQRKPKLRLEVGQKGGISVYGLQKFPVTLYKEQWEALLDYADNIRHFIVVNEHRLKTKD